MKTSYLTSRKRLVQWKPIPETKWCSQNGQYVIKYRPIDTKSQSRRKASKKWTTVTVDRNQNEYKLDGFHDNKKYELQIYGNNGAGDGPSISVQFKHSQKMSRITERMRKPIEIKKLFAIPMPGNSIKVIWQLSNMDSIQLKDFEFRIRWGSEDPFENERIFPKGSRVFTITDLSPDTEYTISAAVFTKVAGNSSMYSREKFEKVKTKPFNEKPAAPINVKVKTLSPTSIRVTWSDQSEDETGSAAHVIPAGLNIDDARPLLSLTGETLNDKSAENKMYQIRMKNTVSKKGEKKVDTRNVTDMTIGNDEKAYEATDLKPFTSYAISVRQIQNGRSSEWSMVANTRTQEAKPSSPPEDFSVNQYDSNNSDGTIGRWQPPLESNGIITEYIIRYTTDKSLPIAKWKSETVFGDALTCPIPDIEPETQYYFVICAKNSKGIGPNTDIVSYKTNPLSSGPIRMTQSVWYILIAVVATLTVIVIGIIIFLLRHNRTLKQSQGLNHHGLNLEHPRSLYSQSQNASEDLFETTNRHQPRFESIPVLTSPIFFGHFVRNFSLMICKHKYSDLLITHLLSHYCNNHCSFTLQIFQWPINMLKRYIFSITKTVSYLNIGALDKNGSKCNVSIIKHESGFVISRIFNGREYQP